MNIYIANAVANQGYEHIDDLYIVCASNDKRAKELVREKEKARCLITIIFIKESIWTEESIEKLHYY